MMKRCIASIAIAFVLSSSLSNGTSLGARLIVESKEVITYTINFNNETSKEWKKRSVAARCNNPGNLRSFHDGSFLCFDNLLDGYEALIRDLIIKQTGRSVHLNSTATVKEFINVYAPPFENNTSKYLNILCGELNVSEGTLINSIDTEELARVIIRVEDPILYSSMYIKEINLIETYKIINHD